jgi:hypothetical protein
MSDENERGTKGSTGSEESEGRPIACKKLTPWVLTKETVEALCREAELLRGLRHPNVVEYVYMKGGKG